MAKTTSALHSISSMTALQKAWKELSKRNKRSRGSDNITISAFALNLQANLESISKSLRSNAYSFSKLRPATVAKQGSTKRRPIQIPTIRDRVVMKSLALYIQPSFSKFDLPCSFAFITGKDRGVKAALSKIRSLIDEGYVYYFEADIIDFFGSVDRARLWSMFSHKVRHRSLIPLLNRCFNLELDDLESYQTEYQDLFLGASKGIPQGGVLSPLLANFYLYEFDRAVTSKGFQLIRYADDFVIMCKTSEEAQKAHTFCRSALEKLGLTIHSLDAPNTKSNLGYFTKEGLTFLGVRLEGSVMYPHKRVVDKFKEKVNHVLRPASGDTLLDTLRSLSNLIRGWGMAYREMRVTKIYGDLDDFIKKEVVKYLKRSGIELHGRDRGRQMRFLGIPSLSAMIQHSTTQK